MTRPAPEQIAEARSRIAYWLHPSRKHLFVEQCQSQIETLLAATEPRTDAESDAAYKAFCKEHGLRANDRDANVFNNGFHALFGPVKP